MELRKPSSPTALHGKKHQLSDVGLTETIRILLQEKRLPMTEDDVLRGLCALGFNLKRFKHPASVIHSALLGMASRRQLHYCGENKAYEMVTR